jgi:hypothetical protein
MSLPFGNFEYRSTDRFEQEYIEEIQAECNELAQDHQWRGDPVQINEKILFPLYLTAGRLLAADFPLGQRKA